MGRIGVMGSLRAIYDPGQPLHCRLRLLSRFISRYPFISDIPFGFFSTVFSSSQAFDLDLIQLFNTNYTTSILI